MITIPRRKQKIKYSRKFACKHLRALGDISNSLQPLCACLERELVLGQRAYVCQVCVKYSQTTRRISEVFEESKKQAEKNIKAKKLEEFEIIEMKRDDDVDLSIEEFEEEEETISDKFEKRKAGKTNTEDSEEFNEVECPFCGEVIIDNLKGHIGECEFAPDDASVEDLLPSKGKKKRKKKAPSGKTTTRKGTDDKEKQKCPYCSKEFIRLGRHLKSCKKRPPDAEK